MRQTVPDTSMVLCGSLCFCACACVGNSRVSKCIIDSCHLLHELAELPAAWVAVTHVLGWCDHGADALPICVLRWAVDLPALLRARVQSLQKQKNIRIWDRVNSLVVCVCCCLSALLAFQNAQGQAWDYTLPACINRNLKSVAAL